MSFRTAFFSKNLFNLTIEKMILFGSWLLIMERRHPCRLFVYGTPAPLPALCLWNAGTLAGSWGILQTHSRIKQPKFNGLIPMLTSIEVRLGRFLFLPESTFIRS